MGRPLAPPEARRPTRSSSASPYDGELNAIYLLPTTQRQGAGRRLTAAVAQHLAACGHRGLIIWALAENIAAGRFYERLGGVVVAEQPIEIGKPLVEVAYGWPDLPALAQSIATGA
ncbi:MAG: GNAT family N-acetyltransferase [Ktedonobacterales bacterium]